MIRALLLTSALALSVSVQAQIPTKIYAQELLDRTLAKSPDVVAAAMHATPPKSGESVVITNIGRIGQPAAQERLRAVQSGQSRLAVARGGDFIEADLPLRDMDGNTIGMLSLAWRYQAGQDRGMFEKRAAQIRDAIAGRVLNVANLMDPFPFDRTAATRTHAQKLVDEIAGRHPELSLLALRAAPQGGEVVTFGSTFGRHGKKANAEDMKIITEGKAHTHILPGGKRFSANLPLRDVAGRTVGILNVGYAVKPGDDEQSLLARAEKFRDQLQHRIPPAEKLAELDP